MIRRSSLLIVLAFAVAACTGGTDATTTTATQSAPTTSDVPETTTTTSGDVTTTSEAAASTTTAPDLSGLEGLSDQVRDQLETLIREAQEIRGLPFLSPPQIRVVTEDELEALVRADIEEQSEDFPPDEALYKMLGLLNEAADFEQIVLDLYGEQVAGYYDGETGEIVIPAHEDGLTVLQRGTLLHELVHALTDQHFSFHETFRTMIDEDRLDEASAYQALIEGDATLAEVLWVQRLTQREIGEFIAQSLEVDTSAFEAAPRFLTESLLFPYETGLAFVQNIYESAGGWSEVNDAYTTLAGSTGSTEQVINPDAYRRDLPVEVEIPDVSIPGYELERTSVWGEHGFRLLLNQGANRERVAEVAAGWGGDAYHQWYDGENAVLLIVYRGDTAGDTRALEEALLAFAMNDFPEDNFVWVDQMDGNLYFIAAHDPAVGEYIRSEVGLPEPTG
jgi:hypothetical protein